eukprot:7778495-Pyramimonas_sp.AAC.1
MDYNASLSPGTLILALTRDGLLTLSLGARAVPDETPSSIAFDRYAPLRHQSRLPLSPTHRNAGTQTHRHADTDKQTQHNHSDNQTHRHSDTPAR